MNQEVIDAYRFEVTGDLLVVIPSFREGPGFYKEEALELSIRKWVVLAALPQETLINDGGRTTCALCFKYDCRDCPVSQTTGAGKCFGTPYRIWWDITQSYYEGELTLPEAAQLEVEFLKSLRKRPTTFGVIRNFIGGDR